MKTLEQAKSDRYSMWIAIISILCLFALIFMPRQAEQPPPVGGKIIETPDGKCFLPDGADYCYTVEVLKQGDL